MFRPNFRKAVGAAALAAIAGVGILAAGMPAGADPKQLDAFVAVGSDTSQDILNAFTGFVNGTNYVPLQSAGGAKQVISFDAVPLAGSSDNCITPKVKAPTMYRPNGSSEGRRALSRAIDGAGYGPAAQCGGTKSVAGLIDVARSSSGPTSGDTGTALTYIPFGRDGMSFGYYRASGGPAVTSLSRAQLISLFTTGPQTIGGVRIVPCGIQKGSGTYAFWQTVIQASDALEEAATDECNDLLGVPHASGRVQENSGSQLITKGNLVPAGQQVVVGFSAANFISQSNGKVPNDLGGAGLVNLGTISDNGSGTNLGIPYQGTAPNLTPRSAFYSDATFGRNIYNVFNTAIIDSAFGNNDIKSLFKGAGSVACAAAAQATVNAFGFLTPTSCGASSLKGSLLTGIQ